MAKESPEKLPVSDQDGPKKIETIRNVCQILGAAVLVVTTAVSLWKNGDYLSLCLFSLLGLWLISFLSSVRRGLNRITLVVFKKKPPTPAPLPNIGDLFCDQKKLGNWADQELSIAEFHPDIAPYVVIADLLRKQVLYDSGQEQYFDEQVQTWINPLDQHLFVLAAPTLRVDHRFAERLTRALTVNLQRAIKGKGDKRDARRLENIIQYLKALLGFFGDILDREETKAIRKEPNNAYSLVLRQP